MALNINTTDVSADGFSPSPSTITTTRTEVTVAAVLGVFASCDCYPLPNSTPPADSTPTCSQVANTRTSMAPRYSALSIATLLIDSSSLNGSSHSEYHKGQVVHVQSRKVRLLIGYLLHADSTKLPLHCTGELRQSSRAVSSDHVFPT